MNWTVLALLLAVVVAVAIQNLWLRRRAEAEATRPADDPEEPDDRTGP